MRVTRTIRWVVRVLLAAVFLAAGAGKLAGGADTVAMFDEIGGGRALSIFVGACEVAGAIGLLVPRLHRLAALGLALLMVGATVVNVSVLGTNPLPTIGLFLAAAFVAAPAGRRAPATTPAASR